MDIRLLYLPLSFVGLVFVFVLFNRFLWKARLSLRPFLFSLAWGAAAFGITALILARFGMESWQPEANLWSPLLRSLLTLPILLWLYRRGVITDYGSGAAYGAAIGIPFFGLEVFQNIYPVIGTEVTYRQAILIVAVIYTLVGASVYTAGAGIQGFGVGMMRFQSSRRSKVAWVAGSLIVSIFIVNWLRLQSPGPDVQGAATIVVAVGGAVGLMIAASRTVQLQHAFGQVRAEKTRGDSLLNEIIPLGVRLSAERDFTRMLETIVGQARAFSNADGGTLYLHGGDDELTPVIVLNTKLNIAMGGTSEKPVNLGPVHLKANGEPNRKNIASVAANDGAPVNIPDAYQSAEYDFSGPKAFDAQMGYRSTSFLCLPLTNELKQNIGVLELINARSDITGGVVPFSHSVQEIMVSLSSLASAALTSYIRMQSLKEEVTNIKVDEGRLASQVSEITESGFFTALKDQVKGLRDRHQKTESAQANVG